MMTKEERIAVMLDQWEILQAINKYPRAIDRHDVDLIHAFFAPDALDHHGDFRGGREAFATWVNDLHEQGTSAHSHHLGVPLVEVKGDRARSETYVSATLKSRSTDTADVLGGRYLDQLERRDGQWVVVGRQMVVDWVMEAVSKDRRGLLERYPVGAWGAGDPSYAHFAELSDTND